jgi:hypothetical protein
MVDITPGEGWNFVYGQASMSDGVGIFSFARYSANFRREDEERRELDERESVMLLKRSCKTMAHEVGHIFGLRHCIYFHCIMNGNNGSEYAPLLSCPVCLRKLVSAAGVSDVAVRVRYEKLLAFYSAQGWENESAVLQQRLVGLEERVAELVLSSSSCGETKEIKENRAKEEEEEEKSSNRRKKKKKIAPAHSITTMRRRRRVLGPRVHLEKQEAGGQEEKCEERGESLQHHHRRSRRGGDDDNDQNLVLVTVIAPRGIIVRENASIRSRKILTLRHGADLYVSDPPNTIRTPKGTVRLETSVGWTTGVTSRGIPMVGF